MAYPTTRVPKIKINSVDRSSLVSFQSIRIEDVLNDVTNQCSFVLWEKSGSIGLVGLQDVIISNAAEDVRYFGGVIVQLDSGEPKGTGKLRWLIDCVDFSWYLEHPEDLITGKYTAKSDQWLIQNVIAPVIPDIDCTTDVDEVLATIDFIEFDGDNPRKALEMLRQRSGAEFYVDYGPGAGGKKANLHYFASGSNAAPFTLTNDSPDKSTEFPHADLHQVDTVPDVNAVEVVGRSLSETRYSATTQDSEQGNLSYTNDGADETFTDDSQRFHEWMTEAPGTAGYRVIVTNADGTEVWAYLGPCIIDDTEQGNLSYTVEGADETFTDDGQNFNDWILNHAIVVTNDDGTVCWGFLGSAVGGPAFNETKVYQDEARTTNGWNGATADPRGDGKTPSSYNVLDDDAEEIIAYTDLALTAKGWNGDTDDPRGDGDTPSSYIVWKAEGDYDYWIKHKIVDNDLITLTDIRARGDQFLADVAVGARYSCTTWEPGLRGGQDVTLVDSLMSINSSLLIRRVTTEFAARKTTGGWYAKHHVEMGARRPRQADVLAGGRNIWDEDKFLPKRPGLIEQEDAGTDVQSQHDLTTYNDQAAYPSRKRFRKSHSDTLGTLVATIDTEELALLEFEGVDSGAGFAPGGYQKIVQDGAAGAAYVPTTYELVMYDDAGNPTEFDIEGANQKARLIGGGAANLGSELSLEVYTDDNWCGPYLTFRKSHSDTIGTKAETQNGEELGCIYFYGVDTGGNWDYGAYILVDQSGAAGINIPTQMMLAVYKSSSAIASVRLYLDGPNEYIRSTKDVLIGTGNQPTANKGKVLAFGDNTADPTMGLNTAGFYGKDVGGTVEAFAIDEAGNAAQLTPHDPETGEWIFFTKNVKTGRVLKVRMEAMMKQLDEVFGGGYIEDYLEEIQ